MTDPSPVPAALPELPTRARREMLAPTIKIGLLAAVIACHVGIGWALTQASSSKLIVGDVAPMEVRMVAGEPAAAPTVESAEPPPPVEFKAPDMAAIVEPPPPDLPPPEFPMAKPDVPAPKPEPRPVAKPQPKPAESKPAAPKPVRDQATAPQTGPKPVEGVPQGAPQAAAGPRTVPASQIGYLVPPSPVYPARSRRAGEQGTVSVRVLVDPAGRPAQVVLQTSSGHPALDEAAVSAVRAAQFRPYVDGGTPQAVWVIVPINFVLR